MNTRSAVTAGNNGADGTNGSKGTNGQTPANGRPANGAPLQAHSKSVGELVGEFKTHLSSGLTSADARSRLDTLGYNELQEAPRETFWHMLFEQFKDFVIIILIVAAGISILVGEVVDAVAIATIVVINAVIGVVQELKAENALRALKKMSAPNARVLRDGVPQSVPAREIVAGDVVLLEAGNYVPADMRLVEAVNLRIDEASLTGESTPSEKKAEIVLGRDAPVGDRKNLAYMGTLVSYGRGKGLVTSTGMNTEIGMIAEMLQSYDEEQTPLQKRLAELGKTLSIIALSVCALVFVIGIVRYMNDPSYHTGILELFMTAVSLAIAAVPEGLPAVVTITLALGMQRMVRRHVLMRKLRAVETLGSTTFICTDKTGTLTQNKMIVTQVFAANELVYVSGQGYDPVGEFRLDGKTMTASDHDPVAMLLMSAALCNDAQLHRTEDETWRMIGDPTEGALVVLAAKAGYNLDTLSAAYQRVGEVPFDSDRKRMTTVHKIDLGAQGAQGLGRVPQVPTPYVAFIKGAPDIILEVCTAIMDRDGARPITADDRQRVLDANEAMGNQALRVLGMAYRPLEQNPDQGGGIEQDLVFIGLAGMIDAARPEVRDAVRLCRQAGMKAVMITGDYKSTATAIAKDLDFFTPGRETMTGAELDLLNDDEFSKVVTEIDVYARVSPQHKVRIVDALKAQNHIVAMTGDGVNDAPALKRANIGVAMGITGSDVAKETADMVLTDDNFASIVAAVEEGRIIYSNIRKFVYYLLACNVAEIVIIFVAQLIGLPLPLRPIQLLWLNLLTDGLPALALALEVGDPDVMQRPPRPVDEPVINRPMWIGISVQAVVVSFAVLTAFVYGLNHFAGLPGDETLTGAQTMAFVALNCIELIVVYAFRSERYSAWRNGLFSNRFLVGATMLSFLLLLAVVYIPALGPIFYTANLGPREWLVMAPLMFLPFIAAELTKLYRRRTS